MFCREFNARSEDDKLPDEMLVRFIELAAKETGAATEDQLTALSLMMFWPDEVFFPVLDIIRSALVREPVARQILTDDLVERLLNYLADSSRMPTQLMACRCFVNLFKHETGRQRLQTFLNLAMMKFPQTETANGNLQIALASLLLNFSIRNYKELPAEVLVSRIAGLFLWATDYEAVYRVLLAAGNLIALGETSVTQQFGNDVRFTERLQKYCVEAVPEQFAKVNEVANELKKALN